MSKTPACRVPGRRKYDTPAAMKINEKAITNAKRTIEGSYNAGRNRFKQGSVFESAKFPSLKRRECPPVDTAPLNLASAPFLLSSPPNCSSYSGYILTPLRPSATLDPRERHDGSSDNRTGTFDTTRTF